MGDELDWDWTLSRDWDEEQRLREERNELIKAQLLDGKTVAYRSSGWSLYPRVHSNDLCCFEPVTFDGQVEVEHIVFCNVQPSGYFYGHLVKEKEWHHGDRCWRYWISNLKGRINGWCYLPHIYGKLFQVRSFIEEESTAASAGIRNLEISRPCHNLPYQQLVRLGFPFASD